MKDNQKYYFITVFRSYDDYGPHGIRCWGFFDNFKEAHTAIRSNNTDMWETIYNFAVIEEYLPGISGYNFHRWFYKYNQAMDMYDRIEEPEALYHYVGFALG